ncbi:MAG: hypothetical protein V2G33_05615 [bacterium JZ-2024 1]
MEIPKKRTKNSASKKWKFQKPEQKNSASKKWKFQKPGQKNLPLLLTRKMVEYHLRGEWKRGETTIMRQKVDQGRKEAKGENTGIDQGRREMGIILPNYQIFSIWKGGKKKGR